VVEVSEINRKSRMVQYSAKERDGMKKIKCMTDISGIHKGYFSSTMLTQ